MKSTKEVKEKKWNLDVNLLKSNFDAISKALDKITKDDRGGKVVLINEKTGKKIIEFKMPEKSKRIKPS